MTFQGLNAIGVLYEHWFRSIFIPRVESSFLNGVPRSDRHRSGKDRAAMKREHVKIPVFHKLFPWLLTVFIFLAFFFLFNIFKKASEFLETKRSDGERALARKLEDERETLRERLAREKEEELNKLKLGYEETIKRLVAEKISMRDVMTRENAGKLAALRQEAIKNSLSRKRETDEIILQLRQEIDELNQRLDGRGEEGAPGPAPREDATDSASRVREAERTIVRLRGEIEELKKRLAHHDAEKMESPDGMDAADSGSPNRDAERIIARLRGEIEELKKRPKRREEKKAESQGAGDGEDSASREPEAETLIVRLRGEIEELNKRLESQETEILARIEKEKTQKDAAVIEEFNRDKAGIKAKVEDLINRKRFREAREEIARWDPPPLAGEMLPLRKALKEAELFEHARKVPARNIYLNILLYERLSELNPGKELYARKTAIYRDKHRKVHGKDKETSDCYDRGYLHGRCMLLSTLGVSCGLDDETRIPEQCAQGRDAFLGLKAGASSM